MQSYLVKARNLGHRGVARIKTFLNSNEINLILAGKSVNSAVKDLQERSQTVERVKEMTQDE